MRRVLRGLRNATFFLLCYAQIPLFIGYLMIGDGLPFLSIQALLLPISFLISLIPGSIGGGKQKTETVVVRQTQGNDPNPDRALRNEALPLPEKRAFPLRALVMALAAVGVAVGVYCLPLEAFRAIPFYNRLVLALIMAVMLPLAVRVIASNTDNAGSVTAGMILYVLSGAGAYYMKSSQLETWLLICGVGFLVMTGWVVNNTSMARGASVREGVRPPAGMRRKNRMMLVVFGIVICVVVYFDRIRQVTIDAAEWIGVKLWRFLLWITNLLAGGEGAVGGPGGGGDGMDMGGMFGEAESGAFWEYTEQLMYVLAFIGGGAFVVWLLLQFYKLFANLVRRLIARLKKFTASVGEEYHDEQESLFDWGETRKELGDGLRKRLERLTKREKKWEQMDAREKVRYILRTLYRKTPDSGNLRSLTVHEALKSVKTGQARAEELAALYDIARYSHREPDLQTAERIRKEAKV